MAVHVDSILFNIDPAIGAGAINLRHDAFHSVLLPEWRGGTLNPEDAPAAYVISQARPGALFMQVSLQKDDDERAVWLRAMDVSPDRGNLLGEIPEFRVEFVDPRPLYLAIQIPSPRLSEVGLHDDEWRWEYRTNLGNWQWITNSRHRIYSLLDLPQSPWDATSGNSYLWPWRQVLDQACEWAKGATTTTQVADLIGARVNALGECVNGKRQFRYDIRDTTATLADNGSFDCVEFLRTVEGQPFAIHKGCCSDVASMVVTFANVLGCRLSNLTLQTRDKTRFTTNPLKPIGQNAFAEPFQFGYHEVAMEGQPGPGARIWDSCFYVGKGDPLEIPKCGDPVRNMPFGEPGGSQYLDRLVQPSFRPSIGLSTQPNRSVTPLVEPAQIKLGISGIAPPASGPTKEKVFIAGLFLEGIGFTGWVLQRVSFPRLANKDTLIDSYWKSGERPDEVLARLRIEIEDTIREAQDRVIQRLGRAAAALNPQNPSAPPEKARGEVVILTALGNLSITAQNVGFDDTDLFALHCELENLFASKQQPETDLGSKPLHPPFRTDIPIRFETTDGSVWFKLFTTTGDLFAQGRDVFYRPGDGSEHAIEVYEMVGMRAVLRYAYEFSLP